MGIDMVMYTAANQLPFKPSEYSNIIRIPIRIFEYQFWYSLPSLNIIDSCTDFYLFIEINNVEKECSVLLKMIFPV